MHFANNQNEAACEVPSDFDGQIMVVKSTDGGVTFASPVPVVQREYGASDMPFSVIGRQTVWGHQIRWASDGNIAVDPTNADHVTVIWSDRGAPNPNASAAWVDQTPVSPAYDPCNAGPGSDLNVYRPIRWTAVSPGAPRTLVDDAGGHSQRFPWGAYREDGSLLTAWDEDTAAAPADTFVHVLWHEGAKQDLSSAPERIDISLTYWMANGSASSTGASP